MFRRMLCLLIAVLVLAGAVPAFSESAEGNSSYDFDLTFQLNADSFPELVRQRAAGYAALVNRLGLRGTVAWNTVTESFDMESTLYFTDDPSLAYPFRMYGTRSRIFLTSQLINNEVILLNMTALMEFALKAKNTLGVPLPYFALLFPYTTESAFSGMAKDWRNVIGESTKSRDISISQFRELSSLWQNELLNDGLLHWWVTGLSSGSESPAVVEAEMGSLPSYYENVTGGKPVTVTVAAGSETWENAAGDTLYAREESDAGLTVQLSLPASGNGYVPSLSYDENRTAGETLSFSLSALLQRDPSAADGTEAEASESAEAAETTAYDPDSDWGDIDSWDEYGYDEDFDDEDENDLWWDESEEEFPDLLIEFHADGTGLPRALPADSAFSLSASVMGALYPDCSFSLRGETKKDGAVTLSLTKPFDSGGTPVTILQCVGTFVPSAEPIVVPDYMQESLEGMYNVFSFNEQKIAAFRSKVLPPLVRSIFSFVAAAPTSACQSFLDDLTDTGMLDMLLN